MPTHQEIFLKWFVYFTEKKKCNDTVQVNYQNNWLYYELIQAISVTVTIPFHVTYRVTGENSQIRPT